MLVFISLYGWAILAGVVASLALGLLGCHLAARDQSMQTLCVGQGATLGVLVGIGVFQSLGITDEALHFVPLVSAFLFSAGAYEVSRRWVQGRPASKSTLFTALFCILLAMGYLVSALFPQLENHLTQVFFGDLATLCNTDAISATVLFTLAILFLVVSWRSLSLESFEIATFGRMRPPTRLRHGLSPRGFYLLTLVTLCFSVQFLGFLFTTVCLFVPTGILRFTRSSNLRRHFVSVALVTTTSTGVGFLLSLALSRLPTVPTITLVMVLELGLIVVWDRLTKRAILA